MILYLHGPDTYRSRERLRRLTGAFRSKYDPEGQGVTAVEGETLTVEAFRKAVSTAGLFSKRRLIIIDGLLTRGKRSTVADGVLEVLESGAVPDDYVVIFWEADLPAKAASALGKYLGKKKAEIFPLLTGTALRRWVNNEVVGRGGRVQGPAAELLISAAGSDLWRLSGEIEKLVAYAAEREITADDVAALVFSPTESRIFSFTDALAARNQAAALRELGRLLDDGTHPLALVQLIANQIRTLLLVEEAARDSHHPATVAKRLQIHPFVAQKALVVLPKFRPDDLRQIFDRLVQLDRKLKSSHRDPAALLEGFVIELAS